MLYVTILSFVSSLFFSPYLNFAPALYIVSMQCLKLYRTVLNVLNRNLALSDLKRTKRCCVMDYCHDEMQGTSRTVMSVGVNLLFLPPFRTASPSNSVSLNGK